MRIRWKVVAQAPSPGVYAPQADTWFLERALRRESPGPGVNVLDLGTGEGTLAVCAARQGARVTATDISWRAVLSTRLNALRARQHLDVRRGDLLAPVRGRTFDLVVSNPPYVPAPGPAPSATGDAGHRARASDAWDAGHDGRAVLDRICAEVPSVLRPGGVLLMVQSGLSGTDTTLRSLTRSGLRATVSDRTRVPFGPVLRARRAWLREHHLIAPEQELEELVIIRAEQI
ncbi:HemK2/MTQ2 family protein methyltransferase [Streptomyces sp. NPDC048664]|uniref:HemK2/MTQ2 family protein methyltransferase n=1 Tax=Streptomyces sp. NPDC048664 TaxID=3154505 RepID=UPI00343CE999